MNNEYGGIIDDARTLMEWRPILPLLHAWSRATDPLERLRALVRVGQFVVDVTDSGQRARAFVDAADRIVSAMAADDSLRVAILGLLR